MPNWTPEQGMIRLELLHQITLRDARGNEVRSVLTQPKRLALLAYLAVEAPGGYLRRDQLLAVFWPELSTLAARQALRQAIYFLRRQLGPAVIVSRGADHLGVDPSAVQVDTTEFQNAIAAGDWAGALERYRGDLLPAFFIPDASAQFDQWLDAARVRLRRDAVRAALGLAQRDEGCGQYAAAAEWARQAVELAPDDQAIMRLAMYLMEQSGESIAALNLFDEWAGRLDREFGLEPSPDTLTAARAIRERAAMARATAPPPQQMVAVVTPPPPPVPAPSSPPLPRRAESTTPRGLATSTLAVLAGIALLASLAILRRSRR
jgi:DNA-binding SARP family transcriptional activator